MTKGRGWPRPGFEPSGRQGGEQAGDERDDRKASKRPAGQSMTPSPRRFVSPHLGPPGLTARSRSESPPSCYLTSESTTSQGALGPAARLCDDSDARGRALELGELHPRFMPFRDAKEGSSRLHTLSPPVTRGAPPVGEWLAPHLSATLEGAAPRSAGAGRPVPLSLFDCPARQAIPIRHSWRISAAPIAVTCLGRARGPRHRCRVGAARWRVHPR